MLLVLVISCDSKFQRAIMGCILRKEKKILLSAVLFWVFFGGCCFLTSFNVLFLLHDEKWQKHQMYPLRPSHNLYTCYHLPSYSSLVKLNTPTLINLASYLLSPLIIFVASISTLPIFALPESVKIKLFTSSSELGCAIEVQRCDLQL